jgi:SAM-dependent methyltransferase
MSKEVNLHIGCGTVYLQNWINVDYKGLSPSKNPSNLAENLTDITHYFRYPYKPAELGKQPNERQIVVDLNANATRLPLAPESVDHILTVNFINHVRFQDFIPMIKDWHRILKPNGELIIDVDDVVGMSRNVTEAKNKEELERALRYLYCHSRSPFDTHLWGYTADYLKELLTPLGFNLAWRNDDFIHHDADYPRFLVCFNKNV